MEEMKESRDILITLFRQIEEKGRNLPINEKTREMLAYYFRMFLFYENFESSLIDFLIQAILAYVEHIRDISSADNDNIFKKKLEDIDNLNEIIRIYEGQAPSHPHQSIIEIVAVVMRINIVELNEKVKFDAKAAESIFPDLPNMTDQNIYLMKTPYFIYDILYQSAFIHKYPEILTYGNAVDTKITDIEEKIIEPKCCTKGYYLPGYYKTMLRQNNGKISETCPACKNNLKSLDPISYKKICDYKKSFSKADCFVLTLTVLALLISILFVIDHIIFH